MSVDAVIFDLGKVLLDFDLEKCFSVLSRSTGVSADRVRSAMFSEKMVEFERGVLSPEQFFEHVSIQIDGAADGPTIREAFDDIFTAMNENIRLAEMLSQRVPVGLVSNTNQSHSSFVERNYKFFHIFKAKIYSHEHALRKPEPDIYHRAIDLLGVPAERTLFIDDLEKNIEGARAIGMAVVHLPPGKPLLPELKAAGVQGIA
jgi:putative hydrolase of the HAD superfamily